jgi:hypothetical protein
MMMVRQDDYRFHTALEGSSLITKWIPFSFPAFVSSSTPSLQNRLNRSITSLNSGFQCTPRGVLGHMHQPFTPTGSPLFRRNGCAFSLRKMLASTVESGRRNNSSMAARRRTPNFSADARRVLKKPVSESLTVRRPSPAEVRQSGFKVHEGKNVGVVLTNWLVNYPQTGPGRNPSAPVYFPHVKPLLSK